MSPQEIAKEAIRLATTHGLSKDVIDLLKEKIALLTEKIAALEQEKSVLQGENANLAKKVVNLEKELDRLRPKQGRLKEGPKKLLQILSHPIGPSLEQAARELGMTKVVAEHHADALVFAEMIRLSNVLIPGQGTMYALTPKGRAYVVENKLVE